MFHEDDDDPIFDSFERFMYGTMFLIAIMWLIQK